jgi:hypothetical protein
MAVATCECVATAQHNASAYRCAADENVCNVGDADRGTPYFDDFGIHQENSTITAINGFPGSNYLSEAQTSLIGGRNM